MKKITTTDKAWLPIALFALSLVLAGLFHEYTACAFGALCAAALAVYGIRHKGLTLYRSFTTLTLLVITASYGLSSLWAIDPGMAFTGFLKLLPVPLFLLLMLQYPQAKEQLLKGLPLMMAGLTVLSLLLLLIPALRPYLSVADRLAGPFQYPNTFALLLLVAQLLLVSSWQWSVKNCALFAVLITGIVFTGSRTVFALAVVSNLAMGLITGSKKGRIITVAAVAGGTGLVLLLAVLTGSDVLNRFLRFSFLESTFAGRFLYFADARPLILKHPFGLGAWGYYYIQQSVQTGVYSTVYVHNDLLQLLLDIGWVPAVFFIICVFKTLKSKKTSVSRKLILATVLLHCCFDFDLQFMSMLILLFCLLEPENGKAITLRWGMGLTAVAGALCLGFLYMSTALFLPAIGQTQTGRMLYPGNTQNNINVLIGTEDKSRQTELAEEILNQNAYVNIAYSVRAQRAYEAGNFTALIQEKNEIFQRFPFQYAEYEQYCGMLITGMEMYAQAGDAASAQFCVQELIKTKNTVEGLADRLSPLGRIIVDQPTTQLPDDLTAYIEALEAQQSGGSQ